VLNLRLLSKLFRLSFSSTASYWYLRLTAGGDPPQARIHSGGTNDGLRGLCDDACNRDLDGSSCLGNRGGPVDYVDHGKCPSPDTKGWGALVGGIVVVPGIKGERLDLVGTLRKQWLWNRRAASATAAAAVLTAIALLI
jgi:hypothetical protein